MFFLSEIEHTLRLPPHLLNQPLEEALKSELDNLFLDKVIKDLGLCVSVYDIRAYDGGFIYSGHGASTYTVKFRLVMFRPFEGEVITARLKESTKTGLRLTLGFFDDIYVPFPLLPAPSHSEPDPEHKDGVTWIWVFEEEPLRIEWEDEIRFKIHEIRYPPIPLPLDEGKDQNDKDSEQKDVKPFAPMVIIGSTDGESLGHISWWV